MNKLRITNYELRVRRGGWTYVELVIVLGIVAAIIGLGSINLLSAQNKTYQTTPVDTLAADMALQQSRAMSGDTSVAGAKTAYGIYFQSDKYILFKGNSYSASDPENLTVSLNSSVSFSAIGFPSSQIIYASASGAFVNYAGGQDTILLRDNVSGLTKVLHVNSYGVLDAVN